MSPTVASSAYCCTYLRLKGVDVRLKSRDERHRLLFFQLGLRRGHHGLIAFLCATTPRDAHHQTGIALILWCEVRKVFLECLWYVNPFLWVALFSGQRVDFQNGVKQN